MMNARWNDADENGEVPLETFSNIHKSERIFVLGNGPSINNYNFDLLKNEVIFGTSRIYKIKETCDINFQYYAISDSQTWEESCSHIQKLDTHLFLTNSLDTDLMDSDHACTYTRVVHSGQFGDFPTNVEVENFRIGGSIVVDIPIQICYYAGFSNVYLLGCDWNYISLPQHHFYDDSALPNEIKGKFNHAYTSKCMEITRNAYEKDNRKLINCTPNSSLTCLSNVLFDDIF